METRHSSNSSIHHISDLFAVYRTRLKPPQKTVERASMAIIRDVSGVVINDTDVEFSPNSRILTLHVPSIVKNEILLSQVVILEKLRLELGPDRAPTILL